MPSIHCRHSAMHTAMLHFTVMHRAESSSSQIERHQGDQQLPRVYDKIAQPATHQNRRSVFHQIELVWSHFVLTSGSRAAPRTPHRQLCSEQAPVLEHLQLLSIALRTFC